MAPHRLVRPVLTVLLVMAVVLAVLWAVQRRLIYFPDPAAPPAAARILPGARDVALDTSDRLRLTAWLIPPAAADRRVAVLVAPGNAGNRRDRLPLATALAAAGFTTLLLDYRGYGGNPGSPTEAGLGRDVRAAWAYLTGAAAFPPGRVILFGESLGAAVVAGLAADLPADAAPNADADADADADAGANAGPGGLVLRSPFISLAAVGREHYPLLPVGMLLRDRYPVAEQVGRVGAPIVVVYGTADSVVPPAHSRTVADRARNAVGVVAVDGADHNDAVLAAGPALVDAVDTLADRLQH